MHTRISRRSVLVCVYYWPRSLAFLPCFQGVSLKLGILRIYIRFDVPVPGVPQASQDFNPMGRTVVNKAELAGAALYVTASGTYAPQVSECLGRGRHQSWDMTGILKTRCGFFLYM